MTHTPARRGFTLIELLVVIAIIGVLSSVVLASLNSARGKARDARRLSDMHSVITALELYYSDNNAYPPIPTTDSNCGASTPTCVGSLSSLVSGGYIGTLPTDPSHNNTNTNYRYCSLGTSYLLLLRNEKDQWCRPHQPTPSTACGWDFYSSC
jgi:type II secretion system protein G